MTGVNQKTVSPDEDLTKEKVVPMCSDECQIESNQKASLKHGWAEPVSS